VGWVMRSDNVQLFDTNGCHEPSPIPLNRPAGTFSRTGGEGWDEGFGSWVASFCLIAATHGLARPTHGLLKRKNRFRSRGTATVFRSPATTGVFVTVTQTTGGESCSAACRTKLAAAAGQEITTRFVAAA
jgi:hypothetical protein